MKYTGPPANVIGVLMVLAELCLRGESATHGWPDEESGGRNENIWSLESLLAVGAQRMTLHIYS